MYGTLVLYFDKIRINPYAWRHCAALVNRINPLQVFFSPTIVKEHVRLNPDSPTYRVGFNPDQMDSIGFRGGVAT